MATPIQGKIYTTAEGDTPELIATKAYGDPNESSKIIETNQTVSPLVADEVITTGTELYIPVDTELANLKQAQLNRGLQ